MITSKKLSKEKKICHGFFNRLGGKSKGIYESLNCGPGSNDKKNYLKSNLKIAKNKISKKAKKIFLVHQTHSKKFFNHEVFQRCQSFVIYKRCFCQ